MAITEMPFAEDSRIVLTEVVSHLFEIDNRSIADPLELAQAWAEVHSCDDAVMGALDTSDRLSYQVIVDTRRQRPRRPKPASSAILHDRAVVLHLAVHRRLVALRDLVETPDL
jgi:hypothetical protein